MFLELQLVWRIRKNISFRTSIGGMFSLVLYIIMCYSSILIAIRIFKREEIKTVERTIGNEYFTNKEYVYPFENNKFMIGISAYAHSISNNSCSEQQTNIHLTNFAFKFYNNQTPSSFIIESIDLVECNKTHFPNLQSDGIYANKIFL